MRLTSRVPIGTLMFLAACSSEGSPPSNGLVNVSEATVNADDGAPVLNQAGFVANENGTTKNSSIESAAIEMEEKQWFPGTSSVTESEVFPLGFRGSWAPTPEDCRDEDGVERIDVFPNGVDYYNWGGRLVRVTQSGNEGSILVKLSYEGLAKFWETEETWTLDPKYNKLAIAGDEPGDYIRCPPSARLKSRSRPSRGK